MVNNTTLRAAPDELFEPFSAKSKSTETANPQGYAIFKLLQHEIAACSVTQCSPQYACIPRPRSPACISHVPQLLLLAH